MKVKAKKKRKRVRDDDLKPPDKLLEAFHLLFKPNSIPLIFEKERGRKNHLEGIEPCPT